MITSKNFHQSIAASRRYRCPDCGKRADLSAFVEQLPSVSIVLDRNDRYYQIHLPGEESPRRFATRPTLEEIIAMVEPAPEPEPEPAPRRRSSRSRVSEPEPAGEDQ